VHQLATDAAAAELPGVPLVELELGDRCADVGRGAARARHGLHHVAAVRRSVCTTSPPIGRGAALGLAAPRRRSPPRSTSPACSWSSSATAALVSAAARARHGLHHVALGRGAARARPDLSARAALRRRRSPPRSTSLMSAAARPSSALTSNSARAELRRRRSPPRSTSQKSAAARPSSALTSNSARAELRRRRSPPRPNSPASCTSPPPIADLRRALLVTAELSPLDGVRHAATFLACQPDTSRVSLAPHPSGITSQSSPRSAELELQITSRLRRSLPRTRPARPLLPPWPANAG